MLVLTIITTVLAAGSAAVAVIALLHAKRSADAAEKSAAAAATSADAAASEDRRQRSPRLLFNLDQPAAPSGGGAIYRVTNTGPADLDSVVVHRPVLGEVEGRVIYEVARTGGDYGDLAELGAIAQGEYSRFTLGVDSRPGLPVFWVKVVSRAGEDEWEQTKRLDFPRQPPRPRIRADRAAR